MDSKHDRYDNLNPNDFTQKDLMLHLLQVAQHSATREDVRDDIDKLDKKIDTGFNKLDAKIDSSTAKLDAKIDKVDSKFNRLQWLIVATIISVFLKDSILSFLA